MLTEEGIKGPANTTVTMGMEGKDARESAESRFTLVPLSKLFPLNTSVSLSGG